MNGRFAEAENELQERNSISGSFSADAQGYSRLMVATASIGDYPSNIAVALALAGDRNRSFEYLQKAFSQQDTELVLCLRFPAFDSMRSDPRYADLMRKLGLSG